MPQENVTLNMGLLLEGMAWLEQWSLIPKAAEQPKFDIPPRGAAGEASLTLMWGAEVLLFVALLRARLDKGEITADQFETLRTQFVFKELGSREALTIAADLPDKYREQVIAFIRYSRFIVQRMVDDGRPGKATAPWSRDKAAGSLPPKGIADVSQAFMPNIPAAPQLLVALAWPITAFGVAAIATGAWYLSNDAEAGVKVKAEQAFSAAQAWQNVKIAQAQIAAGKDVTVPDFVSRGAQIEAAQTSPLFIGGVGAAAGAATVAGIVWGMKKKRKNPSGGKQVRRVEGKQVAVGRSPTGKFRAYILETTSLPAKRYGRKLDVTGAKTYDDAFRLAAADIRKRKRKRNPCASNPKKKRKTTKRKTKRKATSKRKTTRKKTKRKATKRKATKRKTTKRKAAKRNPKRKRKTTKRKTTKRSKVIKKSTFLRKQAAKGRSKKQAEAAWKLRRLARKKAA